MTCKDVREELVAYMDGELSPMGKRAIDGHLAECHGCATEHKNLKQTIDWTHKSNHIEPQAGWWEKLQSQIHLDETKPDLAVEIQALRESISRLETRLSALTTSAKEIMTLEDLAAYLQVDTGTVWNLINEIPHFQVAYELRFKKSSVDEWIRLKENGNNGDMFPWDLPLSWQRRLDGFER